MRKFSCSSKVINYSCALLLNICSYIEYRLDGNLEQLLDAIAAVNVPLPTVDWFAALNVMLTIPSKLNARLRLGLTKLAIQQAPHSKSMTLFMIQWIGVITPMLNFKIKTEDAELLEMIVSDGILALTNSAKAGLMTASKWSEVLTSSIVSTLFESNQNIRNERRSYFQLLFAGSIVALSDLDQSLRRAREQIVYTVLETLSRSLFDDRQIDVIQELVSALALDSHAFENYLQSFSDAVAVIFGSCALARLPVTERVELSKPVLRRLLLSLADHTCTEAVVLAATDNIYEATSTMRPLILLNILDSLIAHNSCDDDLVRAWFEVVCYQYLAHAHASEHSKDVEVSDRRGSVQSACYLLSLELHKLPDPSQIIRRMITLAQSFHSIQRNLLLVILSVRKCLDEGVGDARVWIEKMEHK